MMAASSDNLLNMELKRNVDVYNFVIQTGCYNPRREVAQQWNDGTLMITVNPGSPDSQSEVLMVTKLFPIDVEGSVSCDFWLPKHVGEPKLIKVDLKSNKFELIKDALYVREITVILNGQINRFPIKNYVYPHNPIRGNPTIAKMGCPPHFLVRQGAGTLKHHETDKFILDARDEDLATIQSMFKWAAPEKHPAYLYPGYLDEMDYEKLPRFLKFKEAKLEAFLEIKLYGRKNMMKDMISRKIKTMFTGYISKSFKSLGHYVEYMLDKEASLRFAKEDVKEALKIATLFHDDEEFGRQMICGKNAMVIKQVNELGNRWKEGLSCIAEWSLEDKTLDDVLSKGKLFEVTNDALVGVPHGGKLSQKLTGTDQTWYVTLADALFYLKDNGKLVPVLIRLENKVDREEPTYWSPPEPETGKDDPEYLAWLLAKMYFRCADFQHYAMNSHFARAHAINEIFAIAAYRNMSNAHPTLRLLQPHIQGIIPVNVQARGVIINPSRNAFALFLSGGENINKIHDNFFKTFTYHDLLIPKDVARRGVAEVPGYFYRDDALAYWELLYKYISEMVDLSHQEEGDVAQDEELQNFVREAAECGFRGFPDHAGFPLNIGSKDQLKEYLTAIIFNISVFHSAVNFQAFKFLAFIPNAPSLMRKAPPKQGETVTSERILDTLPVAETASAAMNVGQTLGQYSPIEKFFLECSSQNRRGILGENMAVAEEQEACIKRLTEGMRDLHRRIAERNRGLELKYTVLDPVNVPITTQT